MKICVAVRVPPGVLYVHLLVMIVRICVVATQRCTGVRRLENMNWCYSRNKNWTTPSTYSERSKISGDAQTLSLKNLKWASFMVRNINSTLKLS